MPELDIVIPWLELIPFIVHAKEKFWIQVLKKVYLETSERNVSPLLALHNDDMAKLFCRYTLKLKPWLLAAEWQLSKVGATR